MAATPGPLTRLSDAVREGRLSATALVSESLRRLESTSATLNVATDLSPDEALEAASRIDQGGRRAGVLLGAPLLIKDLEDWRGHPTRKGSLALGSVAPATSDGVTPGRLRNAGALAVGKSTLPEFAIEGFTANLTTGVTRNPWNRDYSPGGSSGGSGAALSAGLALIATATDGGGSVRIPASLCGLVGLKPTNGMIGRWPAPDWIDYSTDGPLATSSDDLRLLYDVMIGPVAGDPTTPTASMVRAMGRRDDLPLIVFAAERTSPLGPLPAGVASAFHEAVSAFSELFSMRVIWKEPDSFFDGGEPDLDWFTVCAAEHVASLGREWVVRHMHEFHVATQEFLGLGLEIEIDAYLEARRRRYLYVRQMDELLGQNGLLLTPSVASEGWLADGRLTSSDVVAGLPPHVYSTAMQNVTGNPAISVPMGSVSTGLPFGMQITAPHYRDHRLLDIAERLESAYPWPRYAPGYESLESVLLD